MNAFHQISVDSKPSSGWLASAILFTVLMFFLLSWHVHYSYFVIENLQHIYINEDYHWHNTVDLSRQITAAARVAAIDSNPVTAHLEQYRKKVLELDALLSEKNDLKFGGGDTDPLIQARSAHGTLRAIEQSALDQVQSGQRDIGLDRLFDENYKIQEQLFLKAMNNFVDQSRHRLIERLQNEKNKELQSLWAAFFVFLVSLSFWVMLIRRLQKWGGILSKEIHEHQKAEEAANALERKYQNLFEYANDPILTLDPITYRLLDVNRKAIDLFGYERDELLELSLSDLMLGDNQNSVEQILKTLCSRNSTISECIYRHKDGHPFSVEISGRLIDAGNKEVYQCFVRDITERKRFQEERLHSQKIEAIGQVADGIAHDFRNALTAISGYNALGQNLLPEYHPALESLTRIDQVIGQANGLIKGILTFSRRQETERQSVELRQLVKNSADLFRRILPAAIALEIDTASVQSFQVSADVTQLQQVLLNLMINARDAMPDGGTLRIALSPAPADRGDGPDTAGWVRIEVSDGSASRSAIPGSGCRPKFRTVSSSRFSPPNRTSTVLAWGWPWSTIS